MANLVKFRTMAVCAVLMFSGLTVLLGGGVSPAKATAGSFTSDPAIDGYIRAFGPTYPPSGGTNVYSATTSIGVGQDYVSPNYRVYRSYISFDTSSIPVGATVTSVSLKLYLDYVWWSGVDSFSVNVFDANIGLALDAGDWNANATFEGTLMNIPADFTLHGYTWYQMTVNPANLNLSGLTQYALLGSKDGIDPANQAYAGFDSGNAAHKPTLGISYTFVGTVVHIERTLNRWLNQTAYPLVQDWNVTTNLYEYEIATVPDTINVRIDKQETTWIFKGVTPACNYTDTSTYLRLEDVFDSITYRAWFNVPKSSPYCSVHLSLFNSFTGEGYFWEQMKVQMSNGVVWDNTTAQAITQPDFKVDPNATYTLRVLDFFDNVLTDYSFVANTQDIYLQVGVPYYSWQVFNMNDQPVLMKIFWNNSGAPWEFFVGPRWQIERLLKGGNYTFETTFYGNNGTVGATVVYHRIIPMSGLNASFLFINGTTLSEIVSSVQGMKSTQEIITSLLTPSTVIIYEQLPVAPIKVMSLTLSLGLKLDPYMILQSTTYQNGTGTTVDLWTPHPLLTGATYYVDSDTLSFSGSYSTHVWVNTTSAPVMNLLNSAILPATFNLLGQNVTVHGNKSLTVSRATTWREVSSYTVNYYPSEHKYQATLRLNDSTSLTYYTPYWFIGFPHNATIDQSTVTVFDVNNHLTLTKGNNFEVTAGGIHLTLSRLNASQNRTFTFTFWDANGTTGMGAPNLIAAAYTSSTLNGIPMRYSAVQWMNPWSSAYNGEMYVTLNFSGGDQLVSSSIVIVDQTTNRQLTTSEWVYTGRTIIILTSGVGTVPVGGGKNFGIYFTLGVPATPTKSDFFFGPIVYGGQQIFVAGYAISWALVSLIAGWGIVGLAYLKKSKQVPSYAVIMVSLSIIVGFAMRALGGP